MVLIQLAVYFLSPRKLIQPVLTLSFFISNSFNFQISLADIMIYDIADQTSSIAKLPAFPPKLEGLIDRVKNNPKIKEYLAKREK